MEPASPILCNKHFVRDWKTWAPSTSYWSTYST